MFNAFADPTAKARWFSAAPPISGTQNLREFDFRVGGRERLIGAWAGRQDLELRRLSTSDIVPNERIIYAYAMQIDGMPISVSLATVEFKPAGNGTRLIITEQGAFLDEFVDGGGREQGTRALLDRLAVSLETETVDRLGAGAHP